MGFIEEALQCEIVFSVEGFGCAGVGGIAGGGGNCFRERGCGEGFGDFGGLVVELVDFLVNDGIYG